jgi:hypothetical protein
VFDGILKYCSERGYPVKKSERTSGIIETDAITNPFEHSRTRLAFTVQAVNSKTAEVTLLISIQNESSGGLWTQAAFSEEEARERYAMMFKEMEKYLVK